MSDTPNRYRPGSLAAIVGGVAAVTLFTITPKDESGRTVAVKLAADGTPAITHIAGPQYLTSYLDIAKVATACDGIADGVKIGQRYSEAQCAAMLDRALTIKARAVMACSPALRADGRDWMRVAAVSHAYQFGAAGWCTSTAHQLIEQGKFTDGCAALLWWDGIKIGGKKRRVEAIAKRSGRRMEYCRTGLPGYPVSTLAARLAPWI